MRKEYIQPEISVVRIGAARVLAVSGNFEEGETITTGLYDDEIDGDDAWSRRFGGTLWGED